MQRAEAYFGKIDAILEAEAAADPALAGRPVVDGIEMARMIACARIVLPRSLVRLSAGRSEMSDETQALCLLAGANSIFSGERLLTTPNPGEDADARLFSKLGLEPLSLASGA